MVVVIVGSGGRIGVITLMVAVVGTDSSLEGFVECQEGRDERSMTTVGRGGREKRQRDTTTRQHFHLGKLPPISMQY